MKQFYKIATVFLFAVSVTIAQSLNINGRVYDKKTGENLVGANIIVKGTNLGTITDLDGNFKIKLPNSKKATLVVSYIGYKTKSVKVTSDNPEITIGLAPDVLKTSEVVISGLASTVKRVNLANSVGTISNKELSLIHI